MIEFLDWDTGFFGVRTGQVAVPLDSVSDVEGFLDEFRNSDFGLVYATVPLCRMELASALLKDAGAFLADIRGILDLDLMRVPGELCDDPYGLEIRHTIENDIEEVRKIAAKCYRGLTRFYRDPSIDDARCDELYSIWAEKDLLDPGITSLVCCRGDEVLGFCTASTAISGEAVLGLIGVSEDSRRSGAGTLLLSAMAVELLSRGYLRLFAVTQLSSTAALRMYQKIGFRLRDSSLVIHMWRSEE